MNGTAELKTERLILRKYRPDDAVTLFTGFGCDPAMYEYSGWNPYATKQMAEETVRRFIDSYADPHFYGWAIEYDHRLIGTIGAYDYDEADNTIETGMSIERSSWGKGFATEALSCILRYLTEQEQIASVTAWCAADNTGSSRAMEKAGMVLLRTEHASLEVGGNRYDKLIYGYTCVQQNRSRS